MEAWVLVLQDTQERGRCSPQSCNKSSLVLPGDPGERMLTSFHDICTTGGHSEAERPLPSELKPPLLHLQ